MTPVVTSKTRPILLECGYTTEIRSLQIVRVFRLKSTKTNTAPEHDDYSEHTLFTKKPHALWRREPYRCRVFRFFRIERQRTKQITITDINSNNLHPDDFYTAVKISVLFWYGIAATSGETRWSSCFLTMRYDTHYTHVVDMCAIWISPLENYNNNN